MSRLSTEREEREAQLREWETDLRTDAGTTSRTSETLKPTSSGKVTVGQIALYVVGIVAALVIGRWALFAFLLPALAVVWHLVKLVAELAIAGYVLYWLWKAFMKKR